MSTRSETPILLLALALAYWPSRAYAQSNRRVPRMEMPKRVALVIGNDAYPGMPLRNAVNDARAIAGILRDIGFETHLKENATKVAFEQAVDDFAGRLGPGDVGLFYYAGHGIEIARENYLVPIDFNGKTRADAKYESYAARQVLDKMQESGAKFRMMVLDACRNNPYSGRSGGGGLARMEAATGEFVAFATAPNKTASDNPSANNGLFTAHLIKALKQAGLKVQELFKRVQEEVFQESNGQQMPYAEDGVIGNFYPNPAGQLSAPTQAPATVAATSPSNVSDMSLQVETEFWKSADAANTVDAYEAYLTRYPTGTFALLATAKLKALRSGPATTSLGSLLRPVTPGTMSRRPTVAIMDFDYGTVGYHWWGDYDIGKGVADHVVDALLEEGLFRVLERKRLETVLAELDFSNSDRADPSAAKLAKVGKVLGVRYIITGSITKFGGEEKTYGEDRLKKAKTEVIVTARLINATTGEVLVSAKGEGVSTKGGKVGAGAFGVSGAGFSMGSSDYKTSAIGEAQEAATKDLVARIVAKKDRLN